MKTAIIICTFAMAVTMTALSVLDSRYRFTRHKSLTIFMIVGNGLTVLGFTILAMVASHWFIPGAVGYLFPMGIYVLWLKTHFTRKPPLEVYWRGTNAYGPSGENVGRYWFTRRNGKNQISAVVVSVGKDKPRTKLTNHDPDVDAIKGKLAKRQRWKVIPDPCPHIRDPYPEEAPFGQS